MPIVQQKRLFFLVEVWTNHCIFVRLNCPCLDKHTKLGLYSYNFHIFMKYPSERPQVAVCEMSAPCRVLGELLPGPESPWKLTKWTNSCCFPTFPLQTVFSKPHVSLRTTKGVELPHSLPMTPNPKNCSESLSRQKAGKLQKSGNGSELCLCLLDLIFPYPYKNR